MKDPMGQRFWVYLSGLMGDPSHINDSAIAEVIARTEDEAEKVALDAIYDVTGKPVRAGVIVQRIVHREAFDIPSFVRWRHGGVKC